MKSVIAILSILVFSCNVKQPPPPEPISTTYIANELARLNTYVFAARNMNMALSQRKKYWYAIQSEEIEFLHGFSIDSLNTPKFNYALGRQKEYIAAKWKAKFGQ